MKIGDLVRDADGEVWTVLNRPIDDIPGAESPGLFRRERSPQVQQYGNHMRHPLVALSPDDPWHCICGSGDDGEWHSLMCAASNTPDEVWYGDWPPRECDHENGECHDVEHQRGDG